MNIIKLQEKSGMKEFLLRKAMVNVLIFVVSLVLIGFGIGTVFQSGTTNREDIKLYNQGIAIYNEAELIPEDVFKSPAKFPEENIIEAAAYFQQAISVSNDNELKALALYNIATMIARDYVIFSYERLSGLGLEDAMGYLKEAVRLDPDNEDAKYNLEYLERIQIERTESSGGVGSGGSTETGEESDRGY
jgi:tetratricopeptide (TPR) repeat protein